MKLIDLEYIKVYAVDAGLQVAVSLPGADGFMNFIIEWDVIKKALDEYYYKGIE